MTYVRQRAPSATWTAFLSSFRLQRKRPEHAPLLREGTRRTPQRTPQPAQGPGPARRPAAAAAHDVPESRRLDGNASTTPPGRPRARPNPKTTGAVTKGPSGGFTKYIQPPARLLSAAASNLPTVRQPRQLKTRETAAHGTMPSRRTPPQARGGFAAPAGQLNATAWGQPQKSSAGSAAKKLTPPSPQV